MDAMTKMALSVFEKLIPKEVLEIFTKENVDRFIGESKNLKLTLEQNLQSIADEQASQRALLEELLQNDRDRSGKRKPARDASDGSGASD